MPVDKVSDWAYMTGLLEDAELWYEPGTTSCYHSHTFGYLVGEVVHRVTGVPFIEFVHRELLDPLGADFHFSITSPADLERVAAVWPVESMPEIPSKMFEAVFLELRSGGDFTSPASLARVNPGGSGLTNARALVRIGAVLATGGELDGHRYLRPETIAEASRTQSVRGRRAVRPVPLRARLRAAQRGVPGTDADDVPLGWLRRVLRHDGPGVRDQQRLRSRQAAAGVQPRQRATGGCAVAGARRDLSSARLSRRIPLALERDAPRRVGDAVAQHAELLGGQRSLLRRCRRVA